MSRKEDVIKSYMEQSGMCLLSERTQKHITDAMAYCFDQGESYGKYGAYIEKQNDKIAEAIIQPENDRVWQEELEDIKSGVASGNNVQAKLLVLIAEMILYRRRGG